MPFFQNFPPTHAEYTSTMMTTKKNPTDIIHLPAWNVGTSLEVASPSMLPNLNLFIVDDITTWQSMTLDVYFPSLNNCIITNVVLVMVYFYVFRRIKSLLSLYNVIRLKITHDSNYCKLLSNRTKSAEIYVLQFNLWYAY